ncbi:MAG: hypothetical protein GY750_20870 [Lentisphaerae bacterium]|nr:hypothetical protein [Lentisphaerota bacterium]
MTIKICEYCDRSCGEDHKCHVDDLKLNIVKLIKIIEEHDDTIMQLLDKVTK